MKWRLLLYIIAGVFLLLLLFSITISWQVSKEASQRIINNAQQVAKAFAQQSVLALLTESEDNVDSALQQVLSFTNVSGAGLVNQQGRIFGWRGDAKGHEHFSSIQWPSTRSYLLLNEDKHNWYIASAVILTTVPGVSETELFDATEEKLGYAVLSFSKDNLSQINNRILLSIIITGSIAILTITFFVGSAIQRQLQPLNTLAQVMAHNHETGEHKMAYVSGAKEVEQIADLFNSMMLTLDEQDEKLRSQRDQLEAEVKIRTSELIVARDAALTSSRHKSEFLANMTHELRTPIQSILGYVELVKEEAENDGHFELTADLDKITRNADRLLGMINCVLDLSKIEAGKMEINLNSLYLSDLIDNVKEATAPLMPLKNNRLIINNQTHNLILRTDSEKLLQIIVNLISNASKFTDSGTISLGIVQEDQTIKFDIEDTGIGIPNAEITNIFEQFTQVDSGAARKFGGTGLGLAISKQLCELLGGKIEAKSVEGRGSCFTIWFPLR